MTVRAFIDAMRAVPVGAALAALGCKPAKRRDRMGPCPACGGPEVHVRDVVWLCYRCQARADTVGTLKLLGGGTWEGARDVAERAGLWDGREPDRVPVVRWRDPHVERRAEVAASTWWAAVWDIGEAEHMTWQRVEARLWRDRSCRARWESFLLSEV